jgi:hypothetical protein
MHTLEGPVYLLCWIPRYQILHNVFEFVLNFTLPLILEIEIYCPQIPLNILASHGKTVGRPTIQNNPDADRDRWSRQISFPTLVWKYFNQLQLSKEVVTVATEMCLAHNIMIRNLNAIYLQCEHVTKPEDVTC